VCGAFPLLRKSVVNGPFFPQKVPKTLETMDDFKKIFEEMKQINPPMKIISSQMKVIRE
jgi:hypothetical protein